MNKLKMIVKAQQLTNQLCSSCFRKDRVCGIGGDIKVYLGDIKKGWNLSELKGNFCIIQKDELERDIFDEDE